MIQKLLPIVALTLAWGCTSGKDLVTETDPGTTTPDKAGDADTDVDADTDSDTAHTGTIGDTG